MESDDNVLEKYILLYNHKNVADKNKWTKLNSYIRKYKIKKVRIDKYLSGKPEEKIEKLKKLAENTVDVDLNYAGLEHLINLRVKETPDLLEIVRHPNDYLKSFILVILNEYNDIVEVIPNGTDRTTGGGTIARYFFDYE